MAGELVAVEGPSASGKSRTVRAAAPELGAIVLAEAYERIQPRPSLAWRSNSELLRLERRLLLEDARRYREGRRLAEGGAVVLADTGFLGPLTYTFGLVRRGWAAPSVLAAVLRETRALARAGDWGLPDRVLYLRVGRSERARRALTDPRGHPTALQARHQTVGAEEGRLYRAVLGPRFGRRFRIVAAEGDVRRVADRLTLALARPLAPGPNPTAAGVLRVLADEGRRSTTSPPRA